jgi:predicted GIY-YIG superfamily endonuclease
MARHIVFPMRRQAKIPAASRPQLSVCIGYRWRRGGWKVPHLSVRQLVRSGSPNGLCGRAQAIPPTGCHPSESWDPTIHLRCGELGPSFGWDDTELEGPQVHNTYFVYLLASRRNGTLYTGVTSDLMGRVAQHRACRGWVHQQVRRHPARVVRAARVDRGGNYAREADQDVAACLENRVVPGSEPELGRSVSGIGQRHLVGNELPPNHQCHPSESCIYPPALR